MINIVILVIVVVLVLTIIMFILLKKIVSTINRESKVYFMMKLQSYDELINEKQKKLSEIKEKHIEDKKIINEKRNEKTNIIIQSNPPKYQIEGLLEVISKIDSEFNLDGEKIIEAFVKHSKSFNDIMYKKLINVKKNINDIGIFNIVTKNEQEQLKLMNNIISEDLLKKYYFSYKKFDINNFLKILDIEIKKNDPIIYVYVSNQKENYNNISDNIKTIIDKTILKGIKIKYHNIMYEYSLSI